MVSGERWCCREQPVNRGELEECQKISFRIKTQVKNLGHILMQTFACRLSLLSSVSRQISSFLLITAELSPPVTAHRVTQWSFLILRQESDCRKVLEILLALGWQSALQANVVCGTGSAGCGNVGLSISSLLVFKLQQPFLPHALPFVILKT